jgi:hypothetical protein
MDHPVVGFEGNNWPRDQIKTKYHRLWPISVIFGGMYWIYRDRPCNSQIALCGIFNLKPSIVNLVGTVIMTSISRGSSATQDQVLRKIGHIKGHYDKYLLVWQPAAFELTVFKFGILLRVVSVNTFGLYRQ